MCCMLVAVPAREAHLPAVHGCDFVRRGQPELRDGHGGAPVAGHRLQWRGRLQRALSRPRRRRGWRASRLAGDLVAQD